MRNYSIKIILLISGLVLNVMLGYFAAGQSKREMRKIFAQAEAYFLYEEYELANPLYLILETPDNYNIKFKIGTCYLNIEGEKDKSIPYLREAVRHSSYEAKSESLKEKRAPLDAYFFLGKAYLINNEPDSALNTLTLFRKLAGETKSKGGMKNFDYIDQEIQACKNFIESRQHPVTFTKKSLGRDFNQGSINKNPAVSYDGNTIVYTEKRGDINAILFSRKERGVWQPPIEITNELHAGNDCTSSSLNKDGTELFLYKTDNYDGSIYSSSYVNGAWTPIKKLNKNINTKYYESHAAISADGKKLYFTSNRAGGQGKLDIYVSEKDGSGDWGPAVNLGAAVNTQFNEDTPFITANDSVLFFSSEGHNSIGGFDNFKSEKSVTGWKTPVNLGYPINTTDDDRFLQPVNNGDNAYYTMTTGYKKEEIFYLTLGNQLETPVFEIKGTYRLADTTFALNKNYSVLLLNQSTGDTIDVGYPNKNTGRYGFAVTPAKIRLVFTGKGYFTQTIDTTILADNPSMQIFIDVTMKRDTSVKLTPEPVYEKIDLTKIPQVASIDSSILVTNMNVSDVEDRNIKDSDVLYYTVQVMALYNPVDVSYFKYIDNMKVIYNDSDKFFRYTTGKFRTREEAEELKQELLRKGYPDDIFVKKVSRE
jgi:hypothetical protein